MQTGNVPEEKEMSELILSVLFTVLILSLTEMCYHSSISVVVSDL